MENPDIIDLNLSNTLCPTEKDLKYLNESLEMRGQTRHPTDSDGHNFQWKTLISERESSLSQIIKRIYTETVRETRRTL